MINTDNNLSTLTPEEFSNYYLNALKNELDVYNLQASKVGFIGFLINLSIKHREASPFRERI